MAGTAVGKHAYPVMGRIVGCPARWVLLGSVSQVVAALHHFWGSVHAFWVWQPVEHDLKEDKDEHCFYRHNQNIENCGHSLGMR